MSHGSLIERGIHASDIHMSYMVHADATASTDADPARTLPALPPPSSTYTLPTIETILVTLLAREFAYLLLCELCSFGSGGRHDAEEEEEEERSAHSQHREPQAHPSICVCCTAHVHMRDHTAAVFVLC